MASVINYLQKFSMNDKIFKKLQNKFFYIPLVIGWILVVIGCTLIFFVIYEDSLTNIQKTLLKVGDSDAPFFDSTDLVYIIEKDGVVSTQQIENSYTEEELNELVYSLFNTPVDDNTFVTSDKRYYIYTIKSSTIKDDVEETVYVLLEYTKEMNTLTTLGITLIVTSILADVLIYVFFKYYSRHAIAPVKNYFMRQQELIANASHELKTPLTIIKTNLDVIESDKNASISDNKKWLDSTNNQVERMNNLILDMLELAKIDANQTRYMRENISFNNIIEGVLLSFEAPCYEKNITLDYSQDEELIIYANKNEIEKLATILLDNAIKYTSSNGKISVVLQKVRRTAVLSVTNTGEGIEPSHLDKIFDRFYKVDPSHKETHKSFGLGLSIAKSIALSLKGNIKCESEVGQYTRFIVEIPLTINHINEAIKKQKSNQ